MGRVSLSVRDGLTASSRARAAIARTRELALRGFLFWSGTRPELIILYALYTNTFLCCCARTVMTGTMCRLGRGGGVRAKNGLGRLACWAVCVYKYLA